MSEVTTGGFQLAGPYEMKAMLKLYLDFTIPPFLGPDETEYL